jgi:hypothetical protein
MTPVEFIAQLNELRRRVRRVLLVGAGLVVLVDLAIILYVLQLYPLAVRSDEALVAHSIGLVACLPAIVALFLVLRRTINKHAPVCRTCGRKAMWGKRSEILTTGHCPSCLAAFFTVPVRVPKEAEIPPTPLAS